MSKGFVLLAEGTDYVKQAALCAMSLKSSGNKYPITLLTCDSVPKKYKHLFENILDIPWYEKTDSVFKTENRWKIYHASPYEQTIVLDTDVLVLQDLEFWWNFLERYDLYYIDKVYTYRKEKVIDRYYRKTFIANNLPNLYNGIHYFRKSDLAHEFYKWVELVSNNWELFYGQYCKEHYPKQPSMDVTVAIVTKILDLDNDITNKQYPYPYFVHMKPRIQGWVKDVPSSWQKKVGTYLTDDLKLKIGNHLQDTIFHYTENDFVTDEVLEKYENKFS
jgi:hypothetical protein